MFRREHVQATMVCPTCGTTLTHEQGMLWCAEHGAFFAYGPQLLVRAPRQPARPQSHEMPWEKNLELRRAS
ncbi:MAG TPA: hypothetical protein VFS21_01270 [Roseiflexaceae bacterium]|nr:hypothetical protein [Roseiflexaceae bacterium]